MSTRKKPGKWTPAMDARLDELALQQNMSYGAAARVLVREFPNCGLNLTKNSISGHIYQRRSREYRAAHAAGGAIPPRPRSPDFVVDRFQRHALQPVGHPYVRVLFELMNEEQCTYRMLAERSGLSQWTFSNWRTHQPKVGDLEAALNCFDVSMRPMKRKHKNTEEDAENARGPSVDRRGYA